ncbi:hypothetical protein DFH09DRAFT_1285537 [Mycena vulgaris]|nr:hypothetical protein DFH09DRAFT_1285537 [Mycena vulgaris]
MEALLREFVTHLDHWQENASARQGKIQRARSVNPESLSEDTPFGQIDSQIDWHLAQIAALRSRRNEAIPIARLPNELMCRIFSIYAADPHRFKKLEWIKLLHVSKGWYNLVMGHQKLWSVIDIYMPDGETPLTIRIIYFESPIYSLILLTCAPRALDLDITGDAAVLTELLTYLSAYSLPLLERLALHPIGADVIPGFQFSDSIIDRAPRLKTLQLYRMCLNFSSLRDLEALTLVSCLETKTSQIPPFGTLVSALQSSSDLRTLELEHVVEWSESAHVHPVVHLPLLQALILRDDAAPCTQSLRHVAFPASARISITAIDIHAGRDITPILVPLRRHLRADGAVVLRLLQIVSPILDDYTVTTLRLAAYASTSAPDPSDYGGTGAGVHLLCIPTKERYVRQIATKVLHALPAEHITHLDARSAAHLTPTSWAVVLALLPNAHTVYLRLDPAAPNLATALRQMAPPNRCPRIRTVHFAAESTDWMAVEELSGALRARDALIDLLVFWKEHGTALMHLDVVEDTETAVMAEKWEVLAGVVGRLTRNGLVYENQTAETS